MEINLTQGYTTVIDDADKDLSEITWYAAKTGIKVYARHAIWKGKPLVLHRLIMERVIGRKLEKTEEVDHIDGDSLNNARFNLRIATRSQNAKNRLRNANNTTGFRGVTFRKSALKNKYIAQVTINGKSHHLGFFPTAEAAFEVFKKAARDLYGDFSGIYDEDKE